jgi:GNAT superfamily N-acetyltransferase
MEDVLAKQAPDAREVGMISSADSHQATTVLSAAFHADPTFEWLFNRDSIRYARRLMRFLRAAHEYHLDQQQPALGLWLAGQLIAVAYVRRPYFDLRYAALFRLLSNTFEGGSIFRIALYKERVERHYPTSPHHALFLLAVQPSHQGRGYGRALLQAVHLFAAAEPRFSGITLDTGNPRNIPFYEAAGYRSVATVRFGNVVETVMEYRPSG